MIPQPVVDSDWNDEMFVPSHESASSLRGTDPNLSRFLTQQKHGRDGTLAVLMIVFALFCFIWAPVLIRRCRNRGLDDDGNDINELARFEAEARAVRATLQRMSMINTLRDRSIEQNDPRLEHRKEFLDNALLTKKVIFQPQQEANEKEARAKEGEDSSPGQTEPTQQKGNVIVLVNTTKCKKHTTGHSTPAPLKDDNASSTADDRVLKEAESTDEKQSHSHPTSPQSHSDESQQLEPCSICLAEYNDGDEICWSHNDKCNHFFHKACIQTWLLTHEECPCCRRDFLCLWDEEAENNNQGSHQPIMEQSSLDWAEELAEEIQQRIFQRQRQLQAELERRDREQQTQQPLQSSSFPMSPTSRTQSGFTTRNTIISVDDMAAGFLLYRHFPAQFGGSRRVRLGSFEQTGNNGDGEGAHFGLPLHGSWNSTRPSETLGVIPGASTVLESAYQSSRQRRLSPGEHQPNRFFAPSTPDTGRRFFSISLTRSASPSTSPSGATTESPRSEQANNNTGPGRRFFGRSRTLSAGEPPIGTGASRVRAATASPRFGVAGSSTGNVDREVPNENV